MRKAVTDIKETKPYATRHYRVPHSPISLKETNKAKLDKYRAPGQSYDGFIYQLIELWEKNNGNYAV